MGTIATFAELLEAVEHLSPDEQAQLIGVIQRRLAERGRQRVVGEVRDGRAEFKGGAIRAAAVDDVMREIES